MRQTEMGVELACPHCRGDIVLDDREASCRDCEREFPRTPDGQFDFRLQDTETRSIAMEIGEYSSFEDIDLKPLQGQNPDTDTDTTELPRRMSPELFSHVPPSDGGTEYVLDLGCGSDTARTAVERKGYDWVGVDIEGEEPSFLADAHSLPFERNTFSAAISLKVLEHLQYPLLALSEVDRVTKPSGVFCGNVAFVEPYHGNSVFHHSPLGILSGLRTAGFDVERIGPAGNGFLHTGARLYPFLPHFLGYVVLSVPYLLHRFWYLVGRTLVRHDKTTEEFRRVRFAREFEFVAVPDG